MVQTFNIIFLISDVKKFFCVLCTRFQKKF